MKFISLLAVLVVIVLSAASPCSSSPFTGLPITGITVQGDDDNPWPHAEQVLPLLGVKPGDTFSSEIVKDGISYLYLKGLFQDIRVDGFPDCKGVKLVYTLTPITVVERVEIRGNRAISSSRIMDVLTGVEGKELRQEKFPEYRSAISTLYQSEGYYNAGVEFTIEKIERHHAVLAINIGEHQATLIGAITFSGNTGLTDRQLRNVMKSRIGEPFKSNVLLDRDMAAILEKYTEAGYPTAKPGPVDINFREGRAYLTVTGNEGPKVTVRFSGNHRFSDSDLKKQVLIWSEHDVSDGILENSADKIRNLYKEDGYSGVNVEIGKTSGPDSLAIVFEIHEGARTRIGNITIEGNTFFSDDDIKNAMSLPGSGWFRSFRSWPYREDLLDKDIDYLHDRYVDAGFTSVDVNKKIGFEGGRSLIKIEISEGPRTRVRKVAFEGNTAFNDAELLALLAVKPGAAYNERQVDEDRYRIVSAYSNKGFLYARIEAEKKTGDGAADIKYKITEDGQVRIGKIILRGNDRTKESVIMRELLVKQGDPYDYGKILESQQRIYRLGYFSQAKLEPVHPAEKEYVKNMVLNVEERPAGAVEMSAGYGDFDRARGSLEVSYRNLRESAEFASIRFEDSNVLKRAAFSYHQPWVFDYPVDGTFGVEWSNSKRLNQDTREIYYETRKTAISYGLEKKFERLKASLTYQLENVKNYNVLPEAVISPEDEGRVRVSSFTPALVWDLRDDIFNPHRGSVNGIALKEAVTAIGSQADFTKLTVQSSWYVPVSSGIIGAVSGRGGIALPHRDTNEIPLHERFYAGGSTTIRGYTQDSVGPSQPGPDGKPVPIGGSSMFILNAELRFMPADGFGFVLFSDAGRVWIDRRNQLSPNLPEDVRPPVRASFGAGIRYGTPVGPLRIDYGQKIHRLPGESPGELHFNIGHTF